MFWYCAWVTLAESSFPPFGDVKPLELEPRERRFIKHPQPLTESVLVRP